MGRYACGLAVVLMAFGTLSCSAARVHDSARGLTIVGPTLRLAWEAVSSSDFSHYEVFSRPRGTDRWTYLARVGPGRSPKLIVTPETLAYGTYEFAVRTVTRDGALSALHTSLDFDADPLSGWFVTWIGPPPEATLPGGPAQ